MAHEDSHASVHSVREPQSDHRTECTRRIKTMPNASETSRMLEGIDRHVIGGFRMLLANGCDSWEVSGATMKLEQNQVWQRTDETLRIVQLERLEVQYKLLTTPAPGQRRRYTVTKKEFCRLIKGARLLSVEEARMLDSEDS